MSLQEKAATNKLTLCLTPLDNQLRDVVEDLRARLKQIEKLDNRLWVTRVFPVDKFSQVLVKSTLPFIFDLFAHEHVNALFWKLW